MLTTVADVELAVADLMAIVNDAKARLVVLILYTPPSEAGFGHLITDLGRALAAVENNRTYEPGLGTFMITCGDRSVNVRCHPDYRRGLTSVLAVLRPGARVDYDFEDIGEGGSGPKLLNLTITLA